MRPREESKCQKGKQSTEAAVREIAEEAGFNHLKMIKKLGIRERMDYLKQSWKITHYFLFTSDELSPQPLEANECTWFPLDELPDFFWPEQKQLIIDFRKEIKHIFN